MSKKHIIFCFFVIAVMIAASLEGFASTLGGQGGGNVRDLSRRSSRTDDDGSLASTNTETDDSSPVASANSRRLPSNSKSLIRGPNAVGRSESFSLPPDLARRVPSSVNPGTPVGPRVRGGPVTSRDPYDLDFSSLANVSSSRSSSLPQTRSHELEDDDDGVEGESEEGERVVASPSHRATSLHSASSRGGSRVRGGSDTQSEIYTQDFEPFSSYPSRSRASRSLRSSLSGSTSSGSTTSSSSRSSSPSSRSLSRTSSTTREVDDDNDSVEGGGGVGSPLHPTASATFHTVRSHLGSSVRGGEGDEEGNQLGLGSTTSRVDPLPPPPSPLTLHSSTPRQLRRPPSFQGILPSGPLHPISGVSVSLGGSRRGDDEGDEERSVDSHISYPPSYMTDPSRSVSAGAVDDDEDGVEEDEEDDQSPPAFLPHASSLNSSPWGFSNSLSPSRSRSPSSSSSDSSSSGSSSPSSLSSNSSRSRSTTSSSSHSSSSDSGSYSEARSESAGGVEDDDVDGGGAVGEGFADEVFRILGRIRSEAGESSDPKAVALVRWLKVDTENPFEESGLNRNYDYFIRQAGANNYRALLAFSVSYVIAHGNDPRIASVWREKAREIPGDEGESAAVRLLALTTQALRSSEVIEAAKDDVDSLAAVVVSTGGPFGVDFEHTATDDELDVMVEALVLSGARVAAAYTRISQALDLLSALYLNPPLPPGLPAQEEELLNQHRFSCFAIAAYGLVGAAGGEEAVLDALPEEADRERVEAVWGQFADRLERDGR